MNWYIESTRKDSNYLRVVKETVTEVMDYFCTEVDKINEEEFNEDKIIELCRDIINKLPILKFIRKEDLKWTSFEEDTFWFIYNKETTIRFNDPLKSIKRDILINNILK
jgi:hypothetical protein